MGKKEKQYRVIWSIDVWDTSPHAAALQAETMLTDPDSMRPAFEVFKVTKDCGIIDLEHDAPDEPAC